MGATIEAKIATETETIEIDKDGLLRITAHKGSVHGEKEALDNIRACQKLIKQPSPAIIDIREAGSTDKKAQNLYMGAENSRCISKAALLISSPSSALIGNLFIDNKHFPVKLFYNESSAIDWLKSNTREVNIQKNKILPFLMKTFPLIALLLSFWLVNLAENTLAATIFCATFIIYNTLKIGRAHV